MGFELGPGMLRRAPRGWQPARAFAVKRRIYSQRYDEHGVPEIEATMAMAVTWRVEPPGGEPYAFEEERSVPAWLDAGALMGHGNRWYKLRLRPQYGLMPQLGVPCHVNPGNAHEIWIDWDAAYKEHIPAWEQEARVRREVAKREGKYDQVIDRIVNPFAGKLRAGEATLADERIAKTRPQPSPQSPDEEGAEHERRMDELARLQKTGRKTRGIVVACSATSRTLAAIPVFELVFEVEGRHVVFEHAYGPRHLAHYQPGREVDIWIDPADPNAICPGR
jgi:hypothetical protein